MRRIVATAAGRVQRVGYREHVYNKTFGRDITGYVNYPPPKGVGLPFHLPST